MIPLKKTTVSISINLRNEIQKRAIFCLKICLIALLFIFNSCEKETPKSNLAQILSFKIGSTDGIIDESKKTINFTLPVFTETTNLIASFTLSMGATAKVNSTPQTSGITANNFSIPLIYSILAEDGTTIVNYTINVSVTKSTEANLLSFSFKSANNKVLMSDVSACLKGTELTLREERIVSKFPSAVPLIPTFSVSRNAKLFLNDVEITSDKTTASLSKSSNILKVVAESGNSQTYILNLTQQITNIETFLASCPTEDIAMQKILSDFEIRIEGQKITTFDCNDLNGKTLQILQALRVMYYLDYQDTPLALPWTKLTFYNWMKDRVQGFNVVDNLGGAVGSCCQNIGGKRFITINSGKNNSPSVIKHTYKEWEGLLGFIWLLGHERRHAEPSGYPHNGNCGQTVTGDAEYNINDLSAYGVSFWLNDAFLTSKYEIGMNCTSAKLRLNIEQAYGDMNWVKTFFCKNAPQSKVNINYKACKCN